jgi:hypothetical protein
MFGDRYIVELGERPATAISTGKLVSLTVGLILALMVRGYQTAGSGTSHGTPYDYDSHVPLIFYGWRIKPGTYLQRTGISDVAPTLAEMLNIETPSGSVGHILEQIAK